MEQYASSSDLAKVLRLTSQRVNQLAKDGVIKREADGKFDLSEAVDNYFSFKYKPPDEELSLEREKNASRKSKT